MAVRRSSKNRLDRLLVMRLLDSHADLSPHLHVQPRISFTYTSSEFLPEIARRSRRRNLKLRRQQRTSLILNARINATFTLALPRRRCGRESRLARAGSAETITRLRARRCSNRKLHDGEGIAERLSVGRGRSHSRVSHLARGQLKLLPRRNGHAN